MQKLLNNILLPVRVEFLISVLPEIDFPGEDLNLLTKFFPVPLISGSILYL
jgi:hypothetical protein